MSSRGKWLAGCAVGAWLLLVIVTLFAFSGSLLTLLMFHLSCALMLGLAFPRPRVFAYTFLAAFLFLGFWAKFVVHQIFQYPFIEPIGDFAATPAQWDRALAAAASAALGAALFRLLHLLRVRQAAVALPVASLQPRWYARAPLRAWTLLLALSLALYACNFHWAFYQTGVNPRHLLPFKLNAVSAWAAYCGIGLIFMLFADWESQRRPRYTWPLVLSLCALGIAMSVSLASRASMLFIIATLLLACVDGQPVRISVLWQRWSWRLPLTLALAFVASLTLVSAVRLQVYEVPQAPAVAVARTEQPALPPAPVASVTTPVSAVAPQASVPPVAQQKLQMDAPHMVRQVMLLSVDRWIGLEAMLALSASHEQSIALFVRGLKEDPALGVKALYQRLSHTQYQFQPDFTYLTLPGAPAVLFYSGSLLVVLVGMFALTGLVVGVEALAMWSTRSPLLAAFLSVLLANSICQMSFPRLGAIFVVMSSVAIFLLGLLLRGFREVGTK